MTPPPPTSEDEEEQSLKVETTSSSRDDATAGAEDSSQSDEGVSGFELQAQAVVSRPFPVVANDDTTTSSSATAPPVPIRRKRGRGIDLLVDLNMNQANSFVLAGSRRKTTAAHSCAEATAKNSNGSFCAFGRHTMQARGGDKHSGPINTCTSAWSTSIQSGGSAASCREGTRKLLVGILDEALAIVDDYLEGEDSDLAM